MSDAAAAHVQITSMHARPKLIQQTLLLLALVLPWLNPFAGGPSAAVSPWLLTLGCAACVLLLGPQKAALKPALVAKAWLVAAIISSTMGLLQYLGVSAQFAPWVNSTDIGEAFANLRQRNQFATLTNIGLASLLWWVAQPQACATRSRLKDAGSLALAMVLVLGNAASSSRTGLLQLLALGGLVWLWGGLRLPPIRRVLAVALLTYAVGNLALPMLAGWDPFGHGMLARLRSGDPVCGSRLTLWRNVLHLISQRPWLGWGWGELDYAHFMTLYAGPRFCEILGNAHNLPLHLAVELGIPAAVLMCGGGIWVILRARPWCERDATRQMAWAVLALILLHSLLEYPLWYGPFQMALGLCVWLLWPKRETVTSTGLANAKPSHGGQTVLALALLAASAYAAWDYHRISQIYLPPEQRDAAYREDTLEKIRGSWLFREQVRFAALSITPLTRDNAAWINAQSHALLHYSPEARVVEKLIESAVMLGRDDEALWYLARYRAAYPQAYAEWSRVNAR